MWTSSSSQIFATSAPLRAPPDFNAAKRLNSASTRAWSSFSIVTASSRGADRSGARERGLTAGMAGTPNGWLMPGVAQAPYQRRGPPESGTCRPRARALRNRYAAAL